MIMIFSKPIFSILFACLLVLSAKSQVTTYSNQDSCLEKTTFTPTDIIELADSFLEMSSKVRSVFQTNFDYLLNTYIEKDNPYFEPVFVHLVDNYVVPGKIDWLQPGEINWMIEKSNQLKATLPGSIAPKLLIKNPTSSAQFFTQLLQPEEKAILMFWDTDCEKCINASLGLNEWLKSNDIEDTFRIITVSSEENIEQWQSNINDKNLNHWEHFLDPTINKDGFRKFSVESTPTLFFIGYNHEIWSKIFKFHKISNFHNLLKAKSLNESIESVASNDDWNLNLLLYKLNQFFNEE